MDARPIAIFDSGLGGLTSVKVLADCLPKEKLIYFGDTSRVPYGTRSRQTIEQYAAQDIRFLQTFSPKAVLVACGTVSSVALPYLRSCFPSLPMLGVVESAVRAALQKTKNGKVLVLGTPATIASGAYADQLTAAGVEVATKACPLFVPLAENGHIAPDDKITGAAVAYYLDALQSFGADTVILGCTHYPLLAGAIGAYLGENVSLIDVGRESALAIAAQLRAQDKLSDGQGSAHFYVSDTVDEFEKTAGIFLHRDIKGEVEQIDIQSY